MHANIRSNRAKASSATARTIALATIYLAADPDPRNRSLVAPDAARWCEQLLSSSKAQRLLCQSAKHRWMRKLWQALESMVLPGIAKHYWQRKNKIEQCCRAAIARGTRRLIVLGAGLDTLALRLSQEFPHLEFLEVDHPATQTDKLERLRAHQLPDNLGFIEADLAQSSHWIHALAASAAPTMIILEGLLMYLTPDRVMALLSELTLLRPQLVLSYMVRWEDGCEGFRTDHGIIMSARDYLIRRWLGWLREPFLFCLGETDVSSWMDRCGFQLQEHIHAPFCAVESSKLRGENLVLAEAKPVSAA